MNISEIVFWNKKKQFANALNNLNEYEDSQDLNLKIKTFFKRKTFESIETNEQFYISPYIESHLISSFTFQLNEIEIGDSQHLEAIERVIFIQL